MHYKNVSKIVSRIVIAAFKIVWRQHVCHIALNVFLCIFVRFVVWNNFIVGSIV